MNKNELLRAPISEFKTLRSSILLGQDLADVKHIERSITQFGMIKPLVVSKAKTGLIVLDGKKRLAAIKRMAFAGTLPRSLVNIPYLYIEDSREIDFHAASILSARDFYTAVTTLKSQGHDIDSIADQLYLCRRTVTDFIHLSYLCLPIRNALFKNIISFDQAQAYATIPDADAQIAVLKDLGPFAKAPQILEAMSDLQDAYTLNATNASDQNSDMSIIATKEFEAADLMLTSEDIVTFPNTAKSYVWARAA